jgi:hypothetical protein
MFFVKFVLKIRPLLSSLPGLVGFFLMAQIAGATATETKNIYPLDSKVPITGWENVYDTAEQPSIYVVEGTLISGFETLAVQLVYVPAYTTNTPSATSLAQASEYPCTPPVPLPIPLEQKAQVTSLSGVPSTTKYMHTSLIFYSPFGCKNELHFVHLQHNPSQEAPRFLASIPTTAPFINGFSGLAPPQPCLS